MVKKSPIHLSNSILSSWQRCKRLYYYREILNLEPKKKSSKLVRGTIIHKMKEDEFSNRDPWDIFKDTRVNFDWKSLEVEDLEKFKKMFLSIEYIMKDYFNTPKYFYAKKVEFPVEMKLSDNIIYKGQVDAFGSITGHPGTNAVYELKTKAKPKDTIDITERFRPQAILYAEALKREGEKITHVFREFIYCPTLSIPEVNKNGSMSKKNITCTWNLYRDTLRKNNLTEANYQDMKEKLTIKVKDKLSTRINDDITGHFVEMAIYEGTQISKTKEFPRSWSYMCMSCPFKEPCYLGLTGGDEKNYLLKNYKNREQYYAEIYEAEEE